VRRPQGYAITKEPGKKDIEEDTFTCAHCNAVRFVKPGVIVGFRQGAWCRLCGGYVCPRPECANQCTPFEKKLEEMERVGQARDRMLREMGITK
jgi:hypothetical protein